FMSVTAPVGLSLPARFFSMTAQMSSAENLSMPGSTPLLIKLFSSPFNSADDSRSLKSSHPSAISCLNESAICGMGSTDDVDGNKLFVAPNNTVLAASSQQASYSSKCGWRPLQAGRLFFASLPNACANDRADPHRSHLTHRFSV